MSRLSDFLEEEIEAGSFPGGAALVGSRDEIFERRLAGAAAVEPSRDPLSAETLFDLASLTKPLATGALVRVAVQRGLRLEDPPGRFLPEWKRTRFEGMTLEQLLIHTSGLPAWYPVYAQGEGPVAYRRTLAGLEPEHAPGEIVLYSDPGFLVLGDVLEVFFAAPLDSSFAELSAAPAGSRARFRPARDPETPAAATEKGDATERRMVAELGIAYEGFRTGVVRGEVHDGNAFRRGGAAGNAGLFGTAEDVWRLARRWLDPGASAFTSDRTPGKPEARGLAWQLARGAGSAVPGFSDAAFGHTGFTGTSVWADPRLDRVWILLTNRIHPEVRPGDFHAVRKRFHQLALDEFPSPRSPAGLPI